MSADEFVRFLEAVPSLKTRTALTTAYAAGLRASETVGLKVRDIEATQHHPGRAWQGRKGPHRDAVGAAAANPTGLLALANPQVWLFPGRDETRHIDVQVLYSACRSACAAASIDNA